MIVYGRNPVREALRGPRRVSSIHATDRAATEEWLAGLDVTRADGRRISELASSEEHQGVCAEVEPFRYADPAALLSTPDALVLALDEVQDPHNLGAVARVAESAGLSGLAITRRRSAEVTPAVCKASAGAVEHLPIARVPNLADWLLSAKDDRTWIYGAQSGGDSVAYTDPDYGGRVIVVMGSEGTGLRRRVADVCDASIHLPQLGQVGSLNISTAAAAIVYGIRMLRQGAGG